MVDNDLKQKKIARQERRSRFGDIDGRHLAKGGVCFTPFALLSTQVKQSKRNLSDNKQFIVNIIIFSFHLGC